jgi:hypothetical protein
VCRSLWASSFLEIGFVKSTCCDDEEEKQYYPRSMIIQISGRVRQLYPRQRSWPILRWENIVDLHSIKDTHPYEWAFSCQWETFPDYIYGGVIKSLDIPFERIECFWVFGEEIDCPQYQNVVMRRILEGVVDHAKALENDKAKVNVGDFFHWKYLYGISPEKLEAFFNGDYEGKMLSFIVDILVWDAVVARGEQWLEIVKYAIYGSTCLNMILAKSIHEKSVSQLPKDTLPPWHVTNHHKYLRKESEIEGLHSPSRGNNEQLWIGIGELANKLPESSVLAAKTALLACNGNVEEAVKVLSVGFNIRSAKRKRTT